MKNIIAYGLVIVFARFCYWFGTLLITLIVAGCLAKASERLRGVVAGVLSGLGGVAASVSLGYFIFRLIQASSAFGVLPLLAATVPLLIPMRKELAQSHLLSDDVAEIRHLMGDQPAAVQDSVAPIAIAVGLRFRVAGAILGLALAFLWVFFVHESTV